VLPGRSSFCATTGSGPGRSCCIADQVV
jgi:hypothetical protein